MNKERLERIKENIDYLIILNKATGLGIDEREKGMIELYNYVIDLEDVIDKAIEYIKRMGKFDGETCTRNFKMMSADFNYLLKILGGKK